MAPARTVAACGLIAVVGVAGAGICGGLLAVSLLTFASAAMVVGVGVAAARAIDRWLNPEELRAWQTRHLPPSRCRLCRSVRIQVRAYWLCPYCDRPGDDDARWTLRHGDTTAN